MRSPLLAKTAAIGLVMLLLMGVLTRIDWLVSERHVRQGEAMRSVAQSLASAQTLLGPLLQRQCSEEWDVQEGEGKARRSVTHKREFTLTSAPQSLNAQSRAGAQARYRGLFKVNGYAGITELSARWPHLQTLQPKAENKDGRLQCAPATVLLALSDVRGIRAAQVAVDGALAEVHPGTGHGTYMRGFRAVLTDARSNQKDQALDVQVTLDLLGTARLSLVPAADEVRWSVRSDWPHPSFGAASCRPRARSTPKASPRSGPCRRSAVRRCSTWQRRRRPFAKSSICRRRPAPTPLRWRKADLVAAWTRWTCPSSTR